MSRIETQYVAEDFLFHPQTPSMTNTSQYLLRDQSFRLPSLAIYDTSLKLGDNSNQGFQNGFSTSNLDITKEKNMQCWNSIQQTFNPLSNNGCNTTGVIPWTPVLPQTAFLNPQQNDENLKKILYVGNSLQENSQNFTIMYSNSESQNYWSTSDNSNDFAAKDDTTQQSNENIMNPVTHFSHQIIYPNKMNMINDNMKYTDSYNFPKCWLLINFERVDEECTIARSTMYGYYIHACIERGEKPMNSAGLGKVIGSVFGRMKNRRLGARGDSRYHYLGIKIKTNSAVAAVPIFLANHYASFHTKTNKNTSNSKNTEVVVEDSFESPESSECFYDISKQRIDLKRIESLEQQPLNYFTQDLNSVSKFKITIQVVNSDKFVDDDLSYKKYLTVFEQLYSLFSDFGAEIIECFKDMNRQKLYIAIKNFWSTDHQIILDQIDGNTNSISLVHCLKDQIVSKFVFHYDCKFYQLLIIKCFGDITNDLSEIYMNKILSLFDAIQEGLRESLPALNDSCYNEKSKSLEAAFKIINGYFDIYALRKSKLQQCVTRPQSTVKLYSICSNNNFEKILENFHNANNFTLSKFLIDLKIYDDFFIQITSLPVLQISQDWLNYIKCIFYKIHNNFETSNTIHVFIQEWCVYQNLVMEYLLNMKQIEIQDTLLLNSLVLKLLIFLDENNKYFDDSAIKNRSLDEI